MNRKILIVEDDEALLKILQLLLENSYDLTLAMNGKQGLELATSQRPDLILMDIMMPEIDGLEVLRRLKDDPKMATIPVILLTAKVGDENIYGGYQLGADYYIPKPFTNAQLLNGINMFLGPQKEAIGS
jgi:CheY-like chemotaxis protein